jgi:L-alanine-DL-glutamate epimerase-like enolase superfamily enzyme
MKVISVQERTVSLGSATANAAISFDTMTASAVVVEVETQRGRFHGLGFSSIGRYGHGGLLRERFIPRLQAASAADLHNPDSGVFCMQRAWAVLMKDEKEGGHGERSGAVGVLETALWDAYAKSEDLPLWALLQREFGHSNECGLPPGQTRVYASGGHYHATGDDASVLADEAKRCLDAGYAWFKMKTGGASEAADRKRIEAAIKAAGDSRCIAVDANCAFDAKAKRQALADMDAVSLRWIEEPVDPLNYRGLSEVASILKTPVATGENCFSAPDTNNLLLYGGLHSDRDILQMDFVLSYGLTEFLNMINLAEAMGWRRGSFIPHAGHQAALHACAGLGLGAHETGSASGPFGGISSCTRIEDGIATVGDRPGTGIENKPALFRYFDGMIN